jgi:hypothetical protein
MKPKKSAAQPEARLKARFSTANPTHACMQRCHHGINLDCEEKRDPDERQWPD